MQAEHDTRQRLLNAGALLIAEKGYGGASIRTICAQANASTNQIHYYFGSKQGLLDAIVEQFGTNVFTVSSRLLQNPAKSRDDFRSRIELLFETTLEAYLHNRVLFLVVLREEAVPPALTEYMSLFGDFLEQGKQQGFVRAELDSEMLTGAMLDRILNQVQFAPWIKTHYGFDLYEPTYRKRWCASNVDLFLYGLLAPS